MIDGAGETVVRHAGSMGAMARAVVPAIVLSVAICVCMLAVAPAPAGDMKYPDWESQWRNPAADRGEGPWDPGKPMGLGQQAPLTAEYQSIFEASLAAQAAGGHGNDRSGACALPGMPRMMSLAGPMEILISPGVTYMVFERTPPRRIYTDGRGFPDDVSYQGNSIGTWIDEDGDGRYDALEIETQNFMGPRALEATGLPLHKDNETIVKERLALDKANSDILHDEITTIDHAFTRPWTVIKSYVRARVPKWTEYNCEVTDTHVVIGTEEYAIDADGRLKPIRKGEPPPSLRYFK
jgi:hypothetical protein